MEGTKSTINDYDEYKHKILQILNDVGVGMCPQSFLDEVLHRKVMQELRQNKAEKIKQVCKVIKFCRNKELQKPSNVFRRENYLRRLIDEKDAKKEKIDEIQTRAFMKKFSLLSDVNMCIGGNY